MIGSQYIRGKGAKPQSLSINLNEQISEIPKVDKGYQIAPNYSGMMAIIDDTGFITPRLSESSIQSNAYTFRETISETVIVTKT